jgi:type II secretory pathway component PulK
MKNRRAVALLLALFTLMLVSLLVVAFLEITTIDLQIVSNHLSRNQAVYLADAGVEDALNRLKSSKSNFSSGLITLPAGSGNTYNVTYASASGRITSVGRLSAGVQVTLEVKVPVTGTSVKIIYYREI